MAWSPDSQDDFEEDALRQVLSIERRIQGLLRDAELDAQRTIDDAQARVRDIRAQAERVLQDEIRELTSQAEREIEEQRRILRDHAEQETAAWARVAESNLDRALRCVLDAITLEGEDR